MDGSEQGTQMILVIDLEVTCADDGSIPTEQMVIIEVGACWATPKGDVIDQFQAFVRPTEQPLDALLCKHYPLIFAERYALRTPTILD